MPNRSCSAWLAAALIALAALPLAAGAAALPAGASITYRKVFKSSTPEFVEIKVTDAGAATYDIRQLDEEASPAAFEVSSALVQKIFSLASQLHNFQNLQLDVHRRVANLGQKTFRYDKDGASNEVTFNYTLDTNASELLQMFEGLARQESDLDNLRRTMKYDRLGVPDVLQHMEADVNSNVLPEPERLLSTLDLVASDARYLDIARQRARLLADHIRNPH